MGFIIQDLGFIIQDLGYIIQDLGFIIQDLGFIIQGLVFQFWVQGVWSGLTWCCAGILDSKQEFRFYKYLLGHVISILNFESCC